MTTLTPSNTPEAGVSHGGTPEADGPTTSDGVGRAAGNGRRRVFRLRGDLPAPVGPTVDPALWTADPVLAVATLRQWAEARTIETVSWYLRDKQAKRWASRILRALAVILAVAGGVVPLLAGNGGGLDARLGYALLAVAAGCVAFDHFFGLSAGWMRDMAVVQALQGKLIRFHLDWAALQAAGTATVEAGLAGIDDLLTEVVRVTEAETGQWITDFHHSVALLQQQAHPSVTSPHDLITWSRQPDIRPK